MSFNTVLQQGKFTSDGTTKLLSIRADADWMQIVNYTNAAATGDDSVRFYWQKGMAALAGLREFKSGGGNNLNLSVMTTTGFTRIDTSTNPLTASIAVSAGTNLTQPVYSTANTSDLVAGDVVRLSSLTGQENLAGIDFQVNTIVANTSFKVQYAIATAPGAAATAGNWRKVKWDPIYYPRRRFVGNITAASPAVVTCTVDHGLTVGQKVRLTVPAVYGMVEMDSLPGTITAVTANTMTLDIDSSGFTAFQFPLPAIVPFSPALVVPFGEDTAYTLSVSGDILAGATENEAFIGMSLPGGADAPGGAANDVMYWVAGRSFSVDNS